VLAVDVGNSRIKYGWFEPETNANGPDWPRCVEFAATPLAAPVPWDTIQIWADVATVRVAIAGSNPVLVKETAQHFRSKCQTEPFVLHTRADLPVTVDVDFPEKVGLDRLLNTVAANALRPATRPAIVVDSGTATTVDWINAAGTFCGGAILPGFALSAEALHRYTALLPKLGLGDLGPDIPVALGKNTEAALRSGIFWGQVGAVRQIIAELCRNDNRPLPDSANEHAPWLLLTGGGASWLSSQFPSAPHVPSLAMYGLVLAAWQAD
jgi:type III pantothenate kinase